MYNDATSTDQIGSAKITVPSGFTGVSITTVTPPAGKTWYWEYSTTINLWADNTPGNLLSAGQSVSVNFSATAPGSANSYSWTTACWTSTNYGGSSFGITGSQPAVTVTVLGPLDHFTITGYPASVTAGSNFGSNNVVVTAYDASNNVKTDYTGQVYFTSTDGAATLPYTSGSKYTFTTGASGDNGVHTFAGTGFTLYTAGSRTITVTNGTISATSSSITVTHGTATSIDVTPATSSVTAGNTKTYTATATDAYGNSWDATSSASWSIVEGGDGGSWSGSQYTSHKAGTWTVKGDLGGGVSDTASLTVNHAALDHIVISPDPATIIVGATQAYSATAYDAYGNTWDVTGSTTFIIVEGGDGGSWSGNVYTSGNAGVWTVKGTYSGKSDTATLTVLPQSKVTAGNYAVMKAPFPLIFTPDVSNSPSGSLLYKLSASNPGQFFYNVFYIGWSGSKDITIPFPFVTQGTNPVHVYKGASFDGTTFTPGTEITSDFDISGTPITLSSYSPKEFGQQKSITISVKSGRTGPASTDVVYIVVHLDYGLKGTTPYSPQLITSGPYINNKNALKVSGSVVTTSVVDIPYGQTYTFSATGVTSDTITSKNNFKNDPGIAGFVLDSNGNPIKGATIKISGGDGKNQVSATVTTDEDGWYMFNYKYTGKAATFTVQLLSGTYVDAATGKSYSYTGYTQSPTLKSNSFLVVNFQITLVQVFLQH